MYEHDSSSALRQAVALSACCRAATRPEKLTLMTIPNFQQRFKRQKGENGVGTHPLETLVTIIKSRSSLSPNY
jgi:hypothetical protein